jgi:acyl-CoA thioesterase FadM
LVTTYISEVFARETLEFEVGLMDFNRYGGDVIYRVRKQPAGKLVVLAKTGFVFFDHSTHNIALFPLSFRQKFPSDWG